MLGLSLGGSSKKATSQGVKTNLAKGYTRGITNTRQWNTSKGRTNAQYWTPEQKQLAGQLSSYLSGSFGQPTAGQQTGTEALMRGATGQGYGNIVDPQAANALYAAIEKQTMEDILPKATQAMAGEANLAGMLRSGPALQMQLNQRDQIVNELSKTLAGLRYSDETARRDIEREREGRQMGAAQALLTTDPVQSSINNILQLLGIRGAATEATTGQTKTTTHQDTLERIAKGIKEQFFSKGNEGGFAGGFNISL